MFDVFYDRWWEECSSRDWMAPLMASFGWILRLDTSLDENKEQTSSRPGSTTLVAKNLRKKGKNIPPYPD